MESLSSSVKRKPLPIVSALRDHDHATALGRSRPAPQVQSINEVKRNEDDRSTLMGYTQRPKRKSTAISRLWWSELLCAIISLLSIAAIVVLLRVYDGQPLLDWNLRLNMERDSLSISPNFVVSLLSTLSKSTLAVAVSAALSQAKWHWFSRQEQPLDDYRCFDDASRGPIGSFELLWRTKARRLASIGALITILSLTFDPFLQLLISYPSRGGLARRDDTVQLARAEIFNRGNKNGYVLDSYNNIPLSITSPADEMVAAVNNGVWNTAIRQEPQHRCDRGNCTWDPHVSLSVCSSCFDISQNLNRTEFHQPNLAADTTCSQEGYWVNVSLFPYKNMTALNYRGFANGCGRDLWTSTTSVPNDTINFKDSQTLLFSLTMIRAPPSYLANETRWADTKLQITECGLTVCAVSYNASVRNGKYQERIMEATSVKKPESWIADTTHMIRPNGTSKRTAISRLGPGLPLGTIGWNPLYIGDLYSPPRSDFELQLSPTQRSISGKDTLRLTQNAVESTARFLAEYFGQSGYVWQQAGIRSYTPTTMRGLYSAASLEVVFNNLALDMSATIRNLDNTVTRGYLNDWTVIISVRWLFVIVPASVSILSLIYLISTMFQARKDGMIPWKHNALATLIYGLNKETRSYIRESHRPSELEEAGRVSVILETSFDGPELVARRARTLPDSDSLKPSSSYDVSQGGSVVLRYSN